MKNIKISFSYHMTCDMKYSLRLLLSVFFLFLIPFISFSQISFKDSISNELSRLSSNELRFDSLITWTDHLLMQGDENAIVLAQIGKDLANNLKDEKMEALFEFELGSAYLALEYFGEAHKSLDKSFAYFQGVKNEEKQAEILSHKTRLYTNQGQFDKAYESCLASLKIFEKIDDKSNIGSSFANLSDILWYLRRYEEGLEYGQKSVDIFTKLNDKSGLANAYTQVAYSLLSLKEFDEALDMINKAILYQKDLDENPLALGSKYNARGNIYKHMREFENALADYQVNLNITREVNNKGSLAASLSNIAEVYWLMEKFDEALPYILESIKLQEASGHRANLPEGYCLLNHIYAELDQIDMSCSVFQNAIELRDSIVSEESDRAITEFKTKYETEKKDEQIAAQEATIQQAKTIQTLSFAIVGLLMLFLLGLFYFFRRNKKQNTLLNSQNEVIEERNQQNELLLKEIHHRVKNNLQTISSLLNLQSANIEDAAALDAVKESQSRVASMALIHQKLYQGKNLAAVEMKNYFETMGNTLVKSFNGQNNNVAIEFPMNDVELDVDTAIPIGLIVNELVTNSLKYAFPDNRAGKISLSLKAKDEHNFQLQVKDNGVGHSSTVQTGNISSGFGKKLVKLLTMQLQGEMQILEDEGTAILIDFSSN